MACLHEHLHGAVETHRSRRLSCTWAHDRIQRPERGPGRLHRQVQGHRRDFRDEILDAMQTALRRRRVPTWARTSRTSWRPLPGHQRRTDPISAGGAGGGGSYEIHVGVDESQAPYAEAVIEGTGIYNRESRRTESSGQRQRHGLREDGRGHCLHRLDARPGAADARGSRTRRISHRASSPEHRGRVLTARSRRRTTHVRSHTQQESRRDRGRLQAHEEDWRPPTSIRSRRSPRPPRRSLPRRTRSTRSSPSSKEPKVWKIGPEEASAPSSRRSCRSSGRQWFSLIGDVLDKALSGPSAMSLNSLFHAGQARASSASRLPRRGHVRPGHRQAPVGRPELPRGLLPDLAQRAGLRPRHRGDLMKLPPDEGGLSDEQGMGMIETFLDQNYDSLASFFGERLGASRRASRSSTRTARLDARSAREVHGTPLGDSRRLLNWPWRRFEAFYAAFVKATDDRVAHTPQGRQWSQALWANSNYDDEGRN
jgi:hypothetical protein